ncbi:MAG: hypothetical protein RLZZ584_809 [Pseudomonadota bacterium]
MPGAAPHDDSRGDAAQFARALQQRVDAVRRASVELTRGWSAEDMALQSMPDASPAKWHLAHTSWFFEAMLLAPPGQAPMPGYEPLDRRYFHLYNSYYEALGSRHPRPQRGLLSRPALGEVLAYRAHVDAGLVHVLGQADATTLQRIAPVIELGLQHEMQHQELMLTDLLHAFSLNPLHPALRDAADPAPPEPLPGPTQAHAQAPGWLAHPGGLVEVGEPAAAACATHHHGFAFDNETPRHPVWLQPCELADRPVSCGDYLAFVRDGGYRRADLWLSDGWALAQALGWRAPAYWVAADSEPEFEVFGPQGQAPLDLAAPVSALSYHEADAYARWAGARLPTEFEWEALARQLAAEGAQAPPVALPGAGQVWEWTASAYLPYPGFRPLPGAAGVYNGKFMAGQMVLRGGSWATPAAQKRLAYRNFFPPGARWQFSGLRLARDCG